MEVNRDYSLKNSLFVRNLSPNVSENVLRDVFGVCDEIEKVTFKPYPTNASQFFAQIDFASSKGVADGSRLSGTTILGVACACGVIDPVQLLTMKSSTTEDNDFVATDDLMREEFFRRNKEEEEDLRFRTVHVAGLWDTFTDEMLRRLGANFGEVEGVRVERTEEEAFGLIEFKERGPAHVCKLQREFTVDGKPLVITEAKVFVNESEFRERTVHFQNPILDALNMRTVLACQDELKDKINQVRAAAKEIVDPDAAAASDASSSSSSSESEKEKESEEKRADSSVERELERKREKKERRERKKQKKEKRRQKLERKQERERRRLAGEARQDSVDKSASEEDGGPVALSDESSGTIELDDEDLEVVPNTDLLVLGSSCSSSSSSSDQEGAEKSAAVQARTSAKAPAQRQDDLNTSKDHVLKDGVWDIDAVIATEVMDVEAEEVNREQRRARRKENTKTVTSTCVAGACMVPNCMRPGGHDGPHIDILGATLIVKVHGKVSNDYATRFATAGVDTRRKKSRSRSRSRRRRRKRT
eukprot:TRINITY_DN61882_c0_g1_i1.p1 TRINITY_DN61882_c0_g1~~TRINITY_DN61882_c0_g1_i1.p1  ORF type:complete len:532 (-),score=136.49 TRINITY_DN61882_c0_g1_i1:89-1684(-)